MGMLKLGRRHVYNETNRYFIGKGHSVGVVFLLVKAPTKPIKNIKFHRKPFQILAWANLTELFTWEVYVMVPTLLLFSYASSLTKSPLKLWNGRVKGWLSAAKKVLLF